MKKLTLLAALLAATIAHAATWVQTFGGTDTEWGYCVQQTSDDGYIISGFTYSFGTPGVAEIWLIKLDSLGSKDWDYTYAEGGGKCVRQTTDGGYILTGLRTIKTDENGDTIWTRDFGATGYCVQIVNDGNYVISGIKSTALWLTKIDENGNTIWERTYQKGNYEDVGECVVQTSDGGYIITGNTIEVDYEEMMAKGFLWLLKTDANGDTVWTRTYGGEVWDHYDRGHCVRQASDGGYVIAGTLLVEGKLYSLIKTDTDGNIEWTSIRGGECHCVEELQDGGYIVTGGTEWGTATSSFTPLNGDLRLTKTDENGDTVWTREYGGGGTDAGRFVQRTTDKGYIVTGYTWSYGAGREDLYLLKTDSLGLLSIMEEPVVTPSKNWHVVIPVGREISVYYVDFPSGFEAKVFDASGRRVSELQNSSCSGTISWGSNYPLGVYFIQVKGLKITSTAKVVLVH